jgi:hypothetical protein
MDKRELEQHIIRIRQMCFLLNGRISRYSDIYRCDFHPHKMKVISYGVKNGFSPNKREIAFNDVFIGYGHIQIRFNGEEMGINTDKCKFLGKSELASAQKVFGKYVDEVAVIYHTEQALKELLREYQDQIKETLIQVAFF